MKPTPTPPAEPAPLLAFGAHPDDIEFGCGGIIARETLAGRPAYFVVCSQGEAGTNGTPVERIAEARKAAALLGATVEFIELDGDAHLEIRAAHAIKLAGIIRRIRPAVVFAPSLAPNQHPDHWRLGQIVRDATRIARYGGLAELKARPAHAVGRLFFYAVSPDAEPAGIQPVLIDISPPEVIAAWTAAMEAHVSQLRTRHYVDFQLARARVHGLNAGLAHVQPLWPDNPLLFDSLTPLTRGMRHF